MEWYVDEACLFIHVDGPGHHRHDRAHDLCGSRYVRVLSVFIFYGIAHLVLCHSIKIDTGDIFLHGYTMPDSYSIPVRDLVAQFGGRTTDVGYDASKLYQIHRRNRVYAWKKEMQDALKDTILQDLLIPQIVCHVRYATDGLGESPERRDVMDGGNRITTLKYLWESELTEEERMKIGNFQITVVVMRNLSPKKQRILFRRLNKSVKVSDGQLYAMSEDSTLVQEALALLNHADYPIRDTITRHFGDTRFDNSSRDLLANAVALISGAIYHVRYLTKSFNEQEHWIELNETISRDVLIHALRPLFHILDKVDDQQPLTHKKKLRAQFTIGKLGPIMYDYLTSDVATVEKKWVRYLVIARRDKVAEEVLKMSGGQNMNATRHKRICAKVDIYLRENRNAAKEEVAHLHHDSDSEDESTSEDE